MICSTYTRSNPRKRRGWDPRSRLEEQIAQEGVKDRRFWEGTLQELNGTNELPNTFDHLGKTDRNTLYQTSEKTLRIRGIKIHE